MLSLLVLLLSISPASDDLASNCNSLSRSRLEAAIGRPLNPGTVEFTRFGSACSYNGGNVEVTISVQNLAVPLDLPAELRNLQTAFPGASLREVNGLGVRAFALEIPGAGVQLHLLPGPREYVLISLMGAGDGAGEAAARIARNYLNPPR